jgi:hypothetical protein
MLNDVEAGSCGRAVGNGRSYWPMFRVLKGAWAFRPNGIGDVLAKTPTRILIQFEESADLVVTQSIDVELVEIIGRVVDDELADILIPKSKR